MTESERLAAVAEAHCRHIMKPRSSRQLKAVHRHLEHLKGLVVEIARRLEVRSAVAINKS